MTDFARLLHVDGPNPEHAAALQLYGRFVGDWDAGITAHGADGTKHTAPGEIHFGWVLEGRAVQDVWIIPRPSGSPAFPIAGNWYGTTLRGLRPLHFRVADFLVRSRALRVSAADRPGARR